MRDSARVDGRPESGVELEVPDHVQAAEGNGLSQ
mgnify:CR=1 FL=1